MVLFFFIRFLENQEDLEISSRNIVEKTEPNITETNSSGNNNITSNDVDDENEEEENEDVDSHKRATARKNDEEEVEEKVNKIVAEDVEGEVVEEEDEEGGENNLRKQTPTPIDWKPQDQCYFCVDGKLLTVNEKGELVAESGTVHTEPELLANRVSVTYLYKFPSLNH